MRHARPGRLSCPARPGRRSWSRAPRAGAALFALLAATALAGCGHSAADEGGHRQQRQHRQHEAAERPRHQKLATTFTRLGSVAPRDTHPRSLTDGTVVHPARQQKVYVRPGGAAFARLPKKELGSPTWVPVIDSRPGWARVLLPSRPNGSTGWIKVTGSLETAQSTYLVDVDVDARTLTLSHGDEEIGTWPVAVGKQGTPTPRGRTYVLASVVDPEQDYSPLILPLGMHSATLDTFGGGPGTVALHGWPDDSVFGHAVSNGCIRVPSVALSKLRSVPLGSLVLIH